MFGAVSLPDDSVVIGCVFDGRAEDGDLSCWFREELRADESCLLEFPSKYF